MVDVEEDCLGRALRRTFVLMNTGARRLLRIPRVSQLSKLMIVGQTLWRTTTYPLSSSSNMLIEQTHYDIPTKLDANGRPIRIFVISPTIRGYPNAKFPGERALMPSILRGLAHSQESIGVVVFRYRRYRDSHSSMR